jgi:hypothetical protein
VSDLARFDQTHHLEWMPSGTYNVTCGIGSVAALYSFDPTDGLEYLRVDYLSVSLNFAILDLDAAAAIMLQIGPLGTYVPLITTAVGGPTTDTHLRATTQLQLPFVMVDFFRMRLEGSSSGIDSSTISATIVTSVARALRT